jgi:hypothetical protein
MILEHPMEIIMELLTDDQMLDMTIEQGLEVSGCICLEVVMLGC